MTKRKFSPHIKSLLHFDYPYYFEPQDGCRDEINGNIFERKGNVKFVNSEKYATDATVKNTPRFGYRCLCSESSSDFIEAPNSNGAFTLRTGAVCELECFIYAIASSEGNIVTFMKGNENLLTVKLTQDNMINLSSTELELNITSNSPISLKTWTHIKISLNSGTSNIYIDGTAQTTRTYTEQKILEPDVIRIGGFNGCIDEFVMRDSQTPNTVPTEPYQGTVSLSSIGGYGNGTASMTVSSDMMINSYAFITACSGTKLSLGPATLGTLAGFSAGAEIMIHVTQKKNSQIEGELGYYTFRRITNVNSTSIITIDKPVTTPFNLETCIKKYYVQAIAMPNANTFSLAKSATITPLKYDKTYGGGIVAIRCKGNMTLNGAIITSGYGPIRDDYHQLTHAGLIDRFIPNLGGAVFIVCGGTLTINSGAIIGCRDNPGIMGYGGVRPVTTIHIVGGGMGGYVKANTIHSRFFAYDGTGSSMFNAIDPSTGGTQGITPGGNGLVGGSGGAGGNASNAERLSEESEWEPTPSGTFMIIVAKKLAVDSDSLITYGRTFSTHRSNADKNLFVYPGGSGTGFCYIACEEMI